MILEQSNIDEYKNILLKIQEKNIESIDIDFFGYNDEGCIESITINNSNEKKAINDDELNKIIKLFSRNLLNETNPGWEIESGSRGQINIDANGITIENDRYGTKETWRFQEKQNMRQKNSGF